MKRNEPNTIAGNVSIDEIYERIVYLLDRLLPVAEEYGVRLANHIPDPPVPAGYRGITRWNSPDVFEGIKKFSQIIYLIMKIRQVVSRAGHLPLAISKH